MEYMEHMQSWVGKPQANAYVNLKSVKWAVSLKMSRESQKVNRSKKKIDNTEFISFMSCFPRNGNNLEVS